MIRVPFMAVARAGRSSDKAVTGAQTSERAGGG